MTRPRIKPLYGWQRWNSCLAQLGSPAAIASAASSIIRTASASSINPDEEWINVRTLGIANQFAKAKFIKICFPAKPAGDENCILKPFETPFQQLLAWFVRVASIHQSPIDSISFHRLPSQTNVHSTQVYQSITHVWLFASSSEPWQCRLHKNYNTLQPVHRTSHWPFAITISETNPQTKPQTVSPSVGCIRYPPLSAQSPLPGQDARSFHPSASRASWSAHAVPRWFVGGSTRSV